MFQAHFVTGSSRNKEWPGKQRSKLINECGAEGTRTPPCRNDNYAKDGASGSSVPTWMIRGTGISTAFRTPTGTLDAL